MKFGLYHGCGNSFLIGLYEDNQNYQLLARKLCQGIDGLIVLKDKFEVKIYNADGSEATMCGNGMRCLAKFAYDMNIIKHLEYDVKTLAGIVPIKIKSIAPFIVAVNLGKPNYDSVALGIIGNINPFLKYPLFNQEVSAVFLGTDHAVIIDHYDLNTASAIATHSLFTRGINVNFVKVINRYKIYVKTYERGVGWTKACGTGAGSSFCLCNKFGLVDEKVEVEVDGGSLLVYREHENVFLEGPAVTIKEPKI